MKLKSLSKLIISMVVLSTMYAGTVAPTLTSRFNNILDANNALPAPSVVLGLEAEVSEGVYVGLDTDGLQNRMYVQLGFGWGTLLTNDFRGLSKDSSLDPFSLVCKAIEANGKPTVKLSDNVNKAMGPNEDVKKYMKIFELSEQNQDSLIV